MQRAGTNVQIFNDCCGQYAAFGSVSPVTSSVLHFLALFTDNETTAVLRQAVEEPSSDPHLAYLDSLAYIDGVFFLNSASSISLSYVVSCYSLMFAKMSSNSKLN